MFSGINANHVAERVIAKALGKRIGRAIRPPRVLATIEWDKEANLELMMLHDDDNSCHFSDFFAEELQPTVRKLLEDGM